MTKLSDVTMMQYVNDFERKAEQLEVVGIKLPDDLLSIMLLASLPAEYENFSVAIESRDEVPTLDYLKQTKRRRNKTKRSRRENTTGSKWKVQGISGKTKQRAQKTN